ncbi:MAG: insulinase family protein [Ruminococcus flavefaciens]|nr:insulinase family protein [Ruminococcus flavefaciens]
MSVDRSIAPPVHPVPQLPMPPIEHCMLPNGVELLWLDDPNTREVVRITMSWNGGAYDAAIAPAAEIAGQLAKTGSKNYSPERLADLLDYNGAWLGAEVSGHNNVLTLSSPCSRLEPLLDALTDLVNNRQYDHREFLLERDKVAAAVATSQQRVTEQAQIVHRQLLFGPEHPAARFYTSQYIKSLDLEQIVEADRSMKGLQTPKVFVAGRITSKVMELLTRYISMIDCNPHDHGSVTIQPAASSESTRRHITVDGTLQSAIKYSIPTINRMDKDYETVRLMTLALGGYFGSRLMTNIREQKGLTYGISAGVYGYHEGAFITIESQCDNAYTEQVITEIQHEIEKLASKPMGQEELTAVKQTATGALLSMLDTPFSKMDYYIVRYHMNTPPDYFERRQQAIAQLTAESLRDTAARYLTNPRILISTAGK